MDMVVKTTAHLPRRPAPPPEPVLPAPPVPGRAPPATTVRLGLLVSAFAALAAVILHVATDVSTSAIVFPVIVIGFTLSWFATARPEDHDDASMR